MYAVLNQNQIIQYNIGSGSIVPWTREKNSDPHLELTKPKARLCHWLPFNLIFETSKAIPQAQESDDQSFLVVERDCDSDNNSSSLSSASDQRNLDDEDYSDVKGIFSLLDVPEASVLSRWADYARTYPLRASDLLIIGATTRTSLSRSECTCSTKKFRNRWRKLMRPHPLAARREVAVLERGAFGISAGYQVVTLKQDFKVKRSHTY